MEKKRFYKSKLNYFLFAVAFLLSFIVIIMCACSANRSIKIKQDANTCTQDVEINTDLKLEKYGN